MSIAETLNLDEFNRKVDSTILRINCPEEVYKTELANILRPWLQDADCDVEYCGRMHKLSSKIV